MKSQKRDIISQVGVSNKSAQIRFNLRDITVMNYKFYGLFSFKNHSFHISKVLRIGTDRERHNFSGFDVNVLVLLTRAMVSQSSKIAKNSQRK